MAEVKRVIDGDTIELRGGERVRLLGINAPEKGQYLYKEAKEYLKSLVEGKTVRLVRDKTNKDKYGRFLRYVFLGDMFINLEMIEKGYASVYIIPPDDKFSPLFLEAEYSAKKSKKGIWHYASLKNVYCIGIHNFHYNAKGNDNENLNDEYVILRNFCNYTLELTGWKITDNINSEYIFPKFFLPGKSKVTIHSGKGENNDTDLYWNREIAVWNNNGDTLRMYDGEGNKILEYSYGESI